MKRYRINEIFYILYREKGATQDVQPCLCDSADAILHVLSVTPISGPTVR